MASPAAIAEDSVQPVPWVFCVLTRGAVSQRPPAAVSRKSALSAPPPWPALEQHRPGAARQEPRACAPSPARLGGDRLAEQAGRLGQVRRDDQGARDKSSQDDGDRLVGEQQVAAGRHHDRIEHDASVWR